MHRSCHISTFFVKQKMIFLPILPYERDSGAHHADYFSFTS